MTTEPTGNNSLPTAIGRFLHRHWQWTLRMREKLWMTEEAVQLAISRAGVTIKGIHTAHVQNIDAMVEANKVVRWKVNVKVTFQVKDELHE